MPRRSWFAVRELDDLLRAVAEVGEGGAPRDPLVDADCAKLARQLRHSARTTVGLLPTSDGTKIQPFATALAFALSLLTEQLSIVLDPERETGEPPGDAGALLHAHVPARLVATLSPFERAPAGAKFEVVKVMDQVLGADRSAFGHVLVDLAGCRLPGELSGAINLLDGIIVVGTAGETTERELLGAAQLVPAHLHLGVVLTRQ